MKKIALTFVSSAGSTRRVAHKIQQHLQTDCEIVDFKRFTADPILPHPILILGSPTYGIGDLHPRWKRFISNNPKVDLSSKTVGMFVLGDQKYHGESFAGAAQHLAAWLEKCNAKLIGSTSTNGYHFGSSPAIDSQGNFPCLVIDEITQRRQTSKRISDWCNEIQMLIRSTPAPRDATLHDDMQRSNLDSDTH